jgi:hypothetical protein
VFGLHFQFEHKSEAEMIPWYPAWRFRPPCGSSPTTAVTHIAIAEMLDGKAVEWMEHVTDEQYDR